MVEVLVGLTPASTFPEWDASTFPEWDALTFPECGVVELGKGIPCYAGTGAFSLQRNIIGRVSRRVDVRAQPPLAGCVNLSRMGCVNLSGMWCG